MKLENFIARRYFISKHRLNFITVISLISTVGIMIGVASLIVVLSVFNGFSSLVESLLTSLDPDIRIEFLEENDSNYYKDFELILQKNKSIETYSPYLFSRSLIESKYAKSIIELKGIRLEKFDQLYDLKNIDFQRKITDKAEQNRIYIGIILANQLQINLGDTIVLYVPSSLTSFLSGFSPVRKGVFIVDGIFYSQNNQYDKSLAIIDLNNAFALLGNLLPFQGFEIAFNNNAQIETFKKEIHNVYKNKVEILNKYEIHKELFSIMKIERLVAYLLLTLIIAVASFNILSSLSMTVLEKKKDISIMKSFGVTDKSLVKIFLNEGAIIGMFGTFFGVIIGLIICWLQIEYKIYPLDPTQYKIDSLPMEIRFLDFFIVAFSSMSLSIISASLPAIRASKTNLIEGIKWE